MYFTKIVDEVKKEEELFLAQNDFKDAFGLMRKIFSKISEIFLIKYSEILSKFMLLDTPNWVITGIYISSKIIL